MNYLLEIRAFHDRLETCGLSSSAVALWYALMHIANKTGWKREVSVAVSVLGTHAGLSASGVKRARTALAGAGLIKWRERGGNRSAVYALQSCVVDYGAQAEWRLAPQDGPQDEPKPGPVPKQEKTAQNNTAKAMNSLGELHGEGDKLFEEFWAAYPRRVGRAAALGAWRRLSPDAALLGRMLEAIAQQRAGAQWQKEGGQYIPYPATWLRCRRWEDEPSVAAAMPVASLSAPRASAQVTEQRYGQRVYDPEEYDGVTPEQLADVRAMIAREERERRGE